MDMDTTCIHDMMNMECRMLHVVTVCPILRCMQAIFRENIGRRLEPRRLRHQPFPTHHRASAESLCDASMATLLTLMFEGGSVMDWLTVASIYTDIGTDFAFAADVYKLSVALRGDQRALGGSDHAHTVFFFFIIIFVLALVGVFTDIGCYIAKLRGADPDDPEFKVKKAALRLVESAPVLLLTVTMINGETCEDYHTDEDGNIDDEVGVAECAVGSINLLLFLCLASSALSVLDNVMKVQCCDESKRGVGFIDRIAERLGCSSRVLCCAQEVKQAGELTRV